MMFSIKLPCPAERWRSAFAKPSAVPRTWKYVDAPRVREGAAGRERLQAGKIAEITGFSTSQYLAGLFHRVMKVTPGASRAAGRAGNAN
jgi:hypothetical protein